MENWQAEQQGGEDVFHEVDGPMTWRDDLIRGSAAAGEEGAE
jgi:hypothetical protein